MPIYSLATVVVQFFTCLMQELDCYFDILNKKEREPLNVSPCIFWEDILLFSLATWASSPLRLLRKISRTLVQDARKMPAHQSWTKSKHSATTCCITSIPTATTCLETLFDFFFTFFFCTLNFYILTSSSLSSFASERVQIPL